MASGRKVALIMGVANKRSIAWSCVESFIRKDWDVIVTCQDPRFARNVQGLMSKMSSNSLSECLTCNVQTDIKELFSQKIPDIVKERKVNAIVHSIAHAPNLRSPLVDTKLDDYLEAHHVSAYSLLEIASHAQDSLDYESSITTLSYLGAVRAIPGYNTMGPAKASLEALVRGLALELSSLGKGNKRIRINAVSAGPLSTLSAKGGISNFSKMREEMTKRSPLGNVTAEQVASTVSFLATEGTGITGQTIYVDGGYSIVSGPAFDD